MAATPMVDTHRLYLSEMLKVLNDISIYMHTATTYEIV